MIYIDFETRSELDIRTVGAWKYSCHPSTEVLCIAHYGPDWANDVDLDTDFISDSYLTINRIYPCNDTIEAHNAFFEYAIWHNIMVPRYDWPVIPEDRWYCSAAKAAYHGLPRKLEDACLALNLDVQKDTEGSRLMMQMSKPRPNWIKTRRGPKWFDSETKLERLYKYCKQDVRAEYALSQALDELPKTERKLWLLDQKINRRGIYCDIELANNAIEIIETLETDANLELYQITDGAISTTGQVAKILDWLVGENLGLPNLQASTVAEILKQNDLTPKAKRILEIRQIHAKSATDKYFAMVEGADNDQRLRDLLFYYGAHTGRWTGKRVQPTNFFTPVFDQSEIEYLIIDAVRHQNVDELIWLFGDPISPLSSMLRATLCASPGHDLIGADYAGIEARVLLWRVNDIEALKKIQDGVDLYIDMAATIYGIEYDELEHLVNLGDKDAVFKRKIGKTAVLGLSYQMGAPKFLKKCHEYGIEIDNFMAEKIVSLYRQKYRKIVKHWYWLNNCAIEKKEPFSIKNRFLQLQLPSGRKLQYCDPKLTLNRFHLPAMSYMAIDSQTRKWRREESYGGKWTENETQATARDIMVMGMMRAENKGYPIIFNVYDELIAEIEKSFGSINEFVDLLCQKPKWALDCPINAKGWRGKKYRK